MAFLGETGIVRVMAGAALPCIIIYFNSYSSVMIAYEEMLMVEWLNF